MYVDLQGCQIPNLASIYLEHIGYKTSGRFVEVGAFNGLNWSNTRALTLAGWRGLMLEPHPHYYADCVQLYRDNNRVEVVNCCAGNYNGQARLFLGGSNSTTVPEMVDVYNDMAWSAISGLRHDKFVDCEMYTLDHLLFERDWPARFDVLVVDVEGAEMDVLDGFSLNWWEPTLAIVETHALYPDERLSAKSALIDDYFGHYDKIYESHINTIYKRV